MNLIPLVPSHRIGGAQIVEQICVADGELVRQVVGEDYAVVRSIVRVTADALFVQQRLDVA